MEQKEKKEEKPKDVTPENAKLEMEIKQHKQNIKNAEVMIASAQGEIQKLSNHINQENLNIAYKQGRLDQIKKAKS